MQQLILQTYKNYHDNKLKFVNPYGNHSESHGQRLLLYTEFLTGSYSQAFKTKMF